MFFDIIKFYKKFDKFNELDEEITLGDYLKKEKVSKIVADDVAKKIGTRVEVRPTLVSDPVMYRILVGPEHKDQIVNVVADIMELGISDYFLTQG